jgi:hypothetical protein
MTNPYTSLEDHIGLLRNCGFTELGLDMRAPAGMIEGVLKEAFTEAQKDAVRDRRLEDIMLSIPARFDGGRDYVTFKIHYVYNPAGDNLRTRSVAAKMDESKKIYLFTRSSSLPTVERIYDDLNEIRMQKVIRLLEGRDHFKKTMGKQL